MSKTLKIKDGDWVANENGQFETATGVNKVSQDAGQCILDAYDNARGYGSYLGFPETFIKMNASDIYFEIHTALNRLIEKQRKDDYLDVTEKINSIVDVYVENRITTILYYFKLIVDSGNTVTGLNEIANVDPASFNHLWF